MLNKEQILTANDFKIVKVYVPQWKGDVHLKTMSAYERDAFEAEIIEQGKVKYENIRARLLVRCICDEQGNLLFSSTDSDALGKKNAGAVQLLFNEAKKMSELSDEDVEQLRKN